MLFKRFYEEEGFEPSARQIVGEFTAYLKKMFSNMPFLFKDWIEVFSALHDEFNASDCDCKAAIALLLLIFY